MITKRPRRLLQVDTNAKTVKGQKKGFMTGILYLAPAKMSGYEVCPQRSAGCTAACLNTAGRAAVFPQIIQSRIAKTKWYFEDRASFMQRLVRDIAALVRKAEREGMTPVVRLNGTSDIPWERVSAKIDPIDGQWVRSVSIFDLFPMVQFYDYTKVTKRALAAARGDMPANYALTFSLTEDNDADVVKVLREGGNVAAVLRMHDGNLPPFMALRSLGGSLQPVFAPDYDTWAVVDGDETDLRFLDRGGVVVGLKAKGKARHDTSGFVR